MIVGPSFVWLHFPKCAGMATTAALRRLYDGKPGYAFDPHHPMQHDSIAKRIESVPDFAVGDRRIICNFRRLPFWIISRVRYEQTVAPHHHVATREMILAGQVFENDGSVNTAEAYARHYTAAGVDRWIRSEYLADDFAAAFGVRADITRENVTPPEIDDVRFHLAWDEIAALYDICPTWATIERKLYGCLFHEIAIDDLDE
jgi:hypothetical protein